MQARCATETLQEVRWELFAKDFAQSLGRVDECGQWLFSHLSRLDIRMRKWDDLKEIITMASARRQAASANEGVARSLQVLHVELEQPEPSWDDRSGPQKEHEDLFLESHLRQLRLLVPKVMLTTVST